MNQKIRQSIYSDPTIPEKQRAYRVEQSSLIHSVRLSKGVIYFIEALHAKKNNDLAKVQNLLAGKTGAAVQFYLCARQNKESNEAKQAKIYYQKVQLLVKKWLNKNLKDIKD